MASAAPMHMSLPVSPATPMYTTYNPYYSPALHHSNGLWHPSPQEMNKAREIGENINQEQPVRIPTTLLIEALDFNPNCDQEKEMILSVFKLCIPFLSLFITQKVIRNIPLAKELQGKRQIYLESLCLPFVPLEALGFQPTVLFLLQRSPEGGASGGQMAKYYHLPHPFQETSSSCYTSIEDVQGRMKSEKLPRE